MLKNQTFTSAVSNGGSSDQRSLTTTMERTHVSDVHAPIPGYWKWNMTKEPNEMKDDSTNNSQQQQEEKPLFTRYQPLLCRGDENKTLPRCIDEMEIIRYEPYQFEFHPEVKSRIETSLASSSLSPMTWSSPSSSAPAAATDIGNTTNIAMANTTVCVVGWSHTRHMIESMRHILYYQNSDIQINWVSAR